jgi:hypothetical protein
LISDGFNRGTTTSSFRVYSELVIRGLEFAAMYSAADMESAKAFLDLIEAEADKGGAHYAPCFRDCLHDNREWVQERLAELICTTVALSSDYDID